MDLNVKHEIIKCLEIKTGDNLQDPELGKEILDLTP